jgi:hypothetical protein
MHFSENIFLLGGKWQPYCRNFALTAQKKSIKNISSLSFFSDKCSATPRKMMWLVEIIRQEDNAVMIPDIFPLLHRGY